MIKIKKINTKLDKPHSIRKAVSHAYEKSKTFFGVEPKEIAIYLVYSRDEMNRLVKRKTPDWFVGGAGSDSIVIFSPSIFESVSNHPKTDFLPTLTHEIAHIFTKSIKDFKEPAWLIEGISGYLAEQYKIRPIYRKNIQDFKNIHSKEDWQKSTNYTQAYSFTKYLVDKFGKDKFLRLIKDLRQENSLRVFSTKVRKNFGKGLVTLQKEWLSSVPE